LACVAHFITTGIHHINDLPLRKARRANCPSILGVNIVTAIFIELEPICERSSPFTIKKTNPNTKQKTYEKKEVHYLNEAIFGNFITN